MTRKNVETLETQWHNMLDYVYANRTYIETKPWTQYSRFRDRLLAYLNNRYDFYETQGDEGGMTDTKKLIERAKKEYPA